MKVLKFEIDFYPAIDISENYGNCRDINYTMSVKEIFELAKRYQTEVRTIWAADCRLDDDGDGTEQLLEIDLFFEEHMYNAFLIAES